MPIRINKPKLHAKTCYDQKQAIYQKIHKDQSQLSEKSSTNQVVVKVVNSKRLVGSKKTSPSKARAKNTRKTSFGGSSPKKVPKYRLEVEESTPKNSRKNSNISQFEQEQSMIDRTVKNVNISAIRDEHEAIDSLSSSSEDDAIEEFSQVSDSESLESSEISNIQFTVVASDYNEDENLNKVSLPDLFKTTFKSHNPHDSIMDQSCNMGNILNDSKEVFNGTFSPKKSRFARKMSQNGSKK